MKPRRIRTARRFPQLNKSQHLRRRESKLSEFIAMCIHERQFLDDTRERREREIEEQRSRKWRAEALATRAGRAYAA